MALALPVAVALLAAACGGGRARGESTLPPIGTRAELTPSVSTMRGAALRALPSRATFAWVTPSEAFTGLLPDEDVATRAELADLREGASAVLRANGWRETTPDSALFRLVIARTSRERQYVATRPDPRNDRIVEPRCDNTRTGTACATPVVQRYPPIREVHLLHEVRVGYAIRRATDGAIAWWILLPMDGKAAVDHVARVTVELLLADAR